MSRAATRAAIEALGLSADFAIDGSYVLVRGASRPRMRARITAALAPHGYRRRGPVWARIGAAPSCMSVLTESGTWPAETVTLAAARAAGHNPLVPLDLVVVQAAPNNPEKIRVLKLLRSGVENSAVRDPVTYLPLSPDLIDWSTVRRSTKPRKVPASDRRENVVSAQARAFLARLVPGRYPTQRAAIEAALAAAVCGVTVSK